MRVKKLTGPRSKPVTNPLEGLGVAEVFRRAVPPCRLQGGDGGSPTITGYRVVPEYDAAYSLYADRRPPRR